MSVNKIDINNFLFLALKYPVIDVRSPAEFEHAHFPQAFNLPLFDNEERKVVGTTYKKQSREMAIKTGLKYFGPKMTGMIEAVEKLTGMEQGAGKESLGSKTILVHCWRGGMRSAGIAWLLDLYGFKVYTLAGGYKSFRQWAHRQFETTYNFKIIGGYTGSGKTGIISELIKNGKVAIDLEGLANHKGSAFGGIGMPAQPTQEMFENLLALALYNSTPLNNGNSLVNKDENKTILWLEDESQRIGNVMLPLAAWKQIRAAQVYFLNIPFEKRLEHIIKDYGKGDHDKIVNAILRIKKRLGGLDTKNAISYLVENNLKECFRILLTYYDKQYLKGLQNRENPGEQVTTIDCLSVNAAQNVGHLLNTNSRLMNA